MEQQKTLTRHQQKVMSVILDEVKNGHPFPTLRKINELLGKENVGTTNGIRKTLEAIGERGHLTKVGTKWVLANVPTREQLIAIVANLVKWNESATKSNDAAWIEAERACKNFI